MDTRLFELQQRLKTEEAVEFKLKEGFHFGGGDTLGVSR